MAYGDNASHTWMDRLGETIDLHGIQRPEVEVVYKDLTITTQALVGSAGVPTVISPVVHLFKVRGAGHKGAGGVWRGRPGQHAGGSRPRRRSTRSDVPGALEG